MERTKLGVQQMKIFFYHEKKIKITLLLLFRQEIKENKPEWRSVKHVKEAKTVISGEDCERNLRIHYLLILDIFLTSRQLAWQLLPTRGDQKY